MVIWRWTGAAWTLVDASGPMLAGPACAAFDARRSVLVVPVVDDALSRVWEWNGRTWRATDAPGPARRSRHSVAFDGASDRVVLIGGRAEPSREMLGDAWSWDGERWTAWAESAQAPPPHASASLVFDPVAKRLLPFGGVGRASGRGFVGVERAHVDAIASRAIVIAVARQVNVAHRAVARVMVVAMAPVVVARI